MSEPSIEIVFVHYGTKLPRHLVLNISRTSQLFPSAKIVLLTDQKYVKGLKNCEVIDVLCEIEIEQTSNALNHPRDFRSGFWITTFLRLIAISKYVIERQNSILHVESDVILAPDFPFEKFKKLSSPIAFPIVGPGLSVASVLYIESSSAAEDLYCYLLALVARNSKTTDMKALDDFRNSNPRSVSLLPLATPSSEYYLDLLGQKDLREMENNFGIFNGAFDGIDIGFYLFGEDPRNNQGFRLIRKLDSSSYLKLNLLNFNYDKNRQFVNIQAGDKEIPLFSLHIHSKDLRAFHLTRFQKLLKRRILNSHLKDDKEFVFRAFLKLLVPFLKRKLKSV